MLNSQNTIFLVIDIQDKLANVLKDSDSIKMAKILATTADIMGIETIVTEQYPQGLGHTVETLKSSLPQNTTFFEKSTFSALQQEGFKEILEKSEKKQVVICGIEAHICVYQTALDLVSAGYEVILAKDACGSRYKYEFKTGINLMKDAGVKISCTEIILFELLKTSQNPHFKSVQLLIK